MRGALVGLLLSLAGSAQAAPIQLPWDPGIRPKVNAIAVDGGRAYLATGDNRAELVVVDRASGSTLGVFDAEGGADALAVKVLRPGVLKLGRQLGAAPETYRLDVTDPSAIEVLKASDRDRSVRWQPDPLPPVTFPDANGDGVFRLACLGDSNTVPASELPIKKWCELLDEMIDDPRFEVVNVAAPGATVVSPNLRFVSDAEQQMQAARPHQPDAVVLAFGTNDRLQSRSPEEVVQAYVARAEVAIAAGLVVYVATTPPMNGCSGPGCVRISWGNILLSLAFPGRVIDFFAGVTDEHFRVPDRIHLNAAGQALRANRALAIIGSPLLP